jgi:hypothetical protein
MLFLIITKIPSSGSSNVVATIENWKESQKRYANWNLSYEDAFKAFQMSIIKDGEEEGDRVLTEKLFTVSKFGALPTKVIHRLSLTDIVDTKGYGKAEYISSTILQSNSALITSIEEIAKEAWPDEPGVLSDIEVIRQASQAKNLFIKVV